MSIRCANPCKGCSFKNVGRMIWEAVVTTVKPIYTLPTGIIFIWSLLWAKIVVDNDLYRSQSIENITMPFTIISTTLAFILPLQAQAAVSRNKASLDNFSAFCGDVLALGWEIIAFARDEEKQTNTVSERNEKKIEDLFDILFVLPSAVKWKFRKSERLDLNELRLVKMKDGEFVTDKKLVFALDQNKIFRQGQRRGSRVNLTKKTQMFKDTRVGKDVEVLQENMLGVDLCELMFAKIYDLIAEIEASDTRKNMLTRTAERIYGAYGNMGNINSFKLPRLYEVFLFVTLGVFVSMLPFTYGMDDDKIYVLSKIGDNIMWHAFIIIYFFLGIDSVTKTIGNAFVSSSNATGFQTVGETESDTNKALHAMFAHKINLQTTISLSSLTVDDSQAKFHRRLIHY